MFLVIFFDEICEFVKGLINDLVEILVVVKNIIVKMVL